MFLRLTPHGLDTTEGSMTAAAGFNGEKFGKDEGGTEVRTEQTPEKLAAGKPIESSSDEPTRPQAVSTAQEGTLQAPVNGSPLLRQTRSGRLVREPKRYQDYIKH